MFEELLGAIPLEQGERPMLAVQPRQGELHRHFAHLQRFEREWVGSEWFTCAEELLDFISAKRRGSVSLRDVTPMDPQELTRVR